MANNSNLGSDEEFAKRLQEEINSEVSTQPSNKSQKSNTPTSQLSSEASSSFSGATFAQLPSDNIPQIPLENERGNNTFLDPPVFEYGEFDEVVTTSPEYSQAVELQRQAFALKIVIAIDFVFALTWIAIGLWYLAGSLIFAPIGFWAVYKYSKRIMLFYLTWLPVSALVEFIFFWIAVSEHLGLVAFLILLVLLIHICTEYVVFQFFKILPREPFSPNAINMSQENV